MNVLPTLDPQRYECHPLHGDDRLWPETNCYLDLWIELLHALGLDPFAMLAFTLSTDFDGEQWEFFKPPPEDLRAVYGIDVREMNLWRPIVEHIKNHAAFGHLLTVEADSWFLPDTSGMSYRIEHQKTTIVPTMLHVEERRLHYFHGRGLHALTGDDFDGALRTAADRTRLPPYAELIRLDGIEEVSATSFTRRVHQLVHDHLRRRPRTNPIERMAERISEDLSWLRQAGADSFHGYAFGTLRQCGAWAETAASFIDWLECAELSTSARRFLELSELAKVCQFVLARAARGRDGDVAEPLERMATAWTDAYEPLVRTYGS